MAFTLTCPNCGPRDAGEFSYGGAFSAANQSNGLTHSARERWFHRYGCQRWLTVERDLRTNVTSQIRWLGEAEA